MARWLDRIYREVDAEASRRDQAETPARRTLLAGVLASAFVLLVGLGLVFLHGEPRPDDPPDLSKLPRGIFQLHGVSLIQAGLLLLATTPILRVCAMATVYLRRREWFMFAVSMFVLLLLALGIRLGKG